MHKQNPWLTYDTHFHYTGCVKWDNLIDFLICLMNVPNFVTSAFLLFGQGAFDEGDFVALLKALDRILKK